MMQLIVLASLFWGAGTSVGQDAPISRIIDQVKEAYKLKERPVVVFRVDDTLFDSRPRMSQLLNDYTKAKLTARPKDAEKIKAIPLTAIQDTVASTLTAAGINDPAILNGAQAFWFKHHNEDAYLQIDTASAGAVALVRALYSAGARLLYYSDRDVLGLQATNQALRAQGFPIGIYGTELVMKPTAATQDAVFKQQLVNYVRQYTQLLAVFTSHTNDINMFRRAFPAATCVYFVSPTTRIEPTLLPDVFKTTHFSAS